MPRRPTNPDEFGRFRVRDRINKRSGTWSSNFYNPETMLLVPNAAASDIYGKPLPPKPYRPETAAPSKPAAPAEDSTTTEKEND